MPFITMLLRDRGLGYSEIGQVFLAACSTLLVFPFLWGMLADRFLPLDRLFTILNLLAAGALWWFRAERNFWGLLLSFTAYYACYNPLLTLLNALSFHHLRDPPAQFGPLRSWGSIGWMLPSLLISAWLIQTSSRDLTFILGLGMAFALIMAGLTFFLPHTPPGAAPSTSARLPYWPAVKGLLLNVDYLTILASFFLVAGSWSILLFYSPPFLEDLGVPRIWIGPVQCIGLTIEVFLFRWRPGFLRAWSYPATIMMGLVALVARHLIFTLSHNPWVLVGSYALAGVVIVFYHIGISILVNAIAGAEVRSTAQTLLVFFGSGLGPMLANWVAGHMAARFHGDLRPVFLFAAVLGALAGLCIFVRRHSLGSRATMMTVVKTSA
jgi:PPP family 3-phenylpropionic acid transporter